MKKNKSVRDRARDGVEALFLLGVLASSLYACLVVWEIHANSDAVFQYRDRELRRASRDNTKLLEMYYATQSIWSSGGTSISDEEYDLFKSYERDLKK